MTVLLWLTNRRERTEVSTSEIVGLAPMKTVHNVFIFCDLREPTLLQGLYNYNQNNSNVISHTALLQKS